MNHLNPTQMCFYPVKQLAQVKKHRHAKHARVIFFVIGAFVELFTVMINSWLNVHQERNWKFMMYIQCYIGTGKIAK